MSDGYSGQHFFGEIDELNDELDKAVGEMRDAGRKKAQTEHDYRVALAKKMWELRACGTPATGMGDLARGDDVVAMRKLERDAAESEYWASQEAINVMKIRVRTVSEQIGRDWGRPNSSY
ncbi:MAG: hypothetical protein IKF14_13825 [Atopobiaceae bacterium]|nr:hypothetical protein [Atopobiaceae bacterium]MBR3160158.1 hypothetical protein [Atopobiaceae bacterium]